MTTWEPSRNQALDLSAGVTTASEARLYESFRHFWHPVLYTYELTDAPQRVTLCGQDLVVVRMNGEVHAFNDLCPHRGSRLSLGSVVSGSSGREELRCAYHGWQYDDSGSCSHIPQRPDLVGRLRAQVKRFGTTVAYGMVWVCLADEPYFDLPSFPEYDQSTYTCLPYPSTTWRCSAPRRVENYTDLSHFAFVHDGLLGNSNEPEVPQHKVWREEPNVLRMYFEKEVSHREGGGRRGVRMSKWSYHIYMPLTVHILVDTEGDHYPLFFHPSPVGPNEIRNFTIAGCNFGTNDTLYDDLVELTRKVYDQDQPVVESQRPEMLTEDLTLELYVKEVDTFTLNYRRWLTEMAIELT